MNQNAADPPLQRVEPARRYRGLTWDHPRGRAALERAEQLLREAADPLDLHWEVHPLSGFESSPIDALAERFDVIVLDHPHLGDALATNSLRPLDEVFTAVELEGWASEALAPAWASYAYGGHQWALPLDAATQVAAMRGDLIPDGPPSTWAEVGKLAEQAPVALSLAGPHALLTFSSICVALGEEPAASAHRYVSESTGLDALEIMRHIASRAPAGSASLDPIAMLEAMSVTGAIAYCPLIFGYVNYAREIGSPGRVRLHFTDAPSAEHGGRPGSTIGGTGLALTRRSEPDRRLLGHLRWLLSDEVQRRFIPDNEGQPGARSAWDDARLNQESGDFYRNTRRTLEQSWTRPRYHGYVRFQGSASAVVRAIATGELEPHAGLERIQRLHAEHVAAAEISCCKEIRMIPRTRGRDATGASRGRRWGQAPNSLLR